jgi:hypothetical protein
MRLTDDEVAVAAMIADAVREVDARIRHAQADGPGARIDVAGEVFQVQEDGSLRVVMPKGTGRPAQARRTAESLSSAEKRSTS